jgi:hypothetical protein
MKDPIVEEVRKARQDHAKEFNHDLAAICNDLKRIERQCGHRLVSFPPKLLTNKVRLCERSEPQSEPFVGRAR